MILLNSLNNEGQWGEGLYQLLNPGANLLAKWLPVFFVPSLITLPLASGLGDVWEVSRPKVLFLYNFHFRTYLFIFFIKFLIDFHRISREQMNVYLIVNSMECTHS